LAAGLTVGIVALPLAMALAIASGLKPEIGIFTAIIGGLLVSALGGSRVQIGGPAGAFVPLLAPIVMAHGPEALVVCAMMAGVILIVLGASKLGVMIKYIPYPVVTGFTSGIAIIILSTQIRRFFWIAGKIAAGLHRQTADTDGKIFNRTGRQSFLPCSRRWRFGFGQKNWEGDCPAQLRLWCWSRWRPYFFTSTKNLELRRSARRLAICREACRCRTGRRWPFRRMARAVAGGDDDCCFGAQ